MPSWLAWRIPVAESLKCTPDTAPTDGTLPRRTVAPGRVLTPARTHAGAPRSHPPSGPIYALRRWAPSPWSARTRVAGRVLAPRPRVTEPTNYTR